jgi:hypothetical protein
MSGYRHGSLRCDSALAHVCERVAELKRKIPALAEARDARGLVRLANSLSIIADIHFDGKITRVQIGADYECQGELESCLEEQVFNRAKNAAIALKSVSTLEAIFDMTTTYELIKQLSANFHQERMIPAVMRAASCAIRGREPVAGAFSEAVCWAQVYLNLAVMRDRTGAKSIADFLRTSGVHRIAMIDFKCSRGGTRREFLTETFARILSRCGIMLDWELIEERDNARDRRAFARHIAEGSEWHEHHMF